MPVLATQDLAVGVKRIAFSLDGLGANDEPPTVRVSLFALGSDNREAPRSVQYARFIAYDAHRWGSRRISTSNASGVGSVAADWSRGVRGAGAADVRRVCGACCWS